MMEQKALEYWAIWYPQAASNGLLFGRGLIEPHDILLVHSPPKVMTVEVSSQQGNLLAYGKDLEQTQTSPICLLFRQGDVITREDIWPGQGDIGRLVLLPGGEVGTLKFWWHAPDKQEWRWQVEFYNSLR